jgi:hypothetical protein
MENEKGLRLEIHAAAPVLGEARRGGTRDKAVNPL